MDYTVLATIFQASFLPYLLYLRPAVNVEQTSARVTMMDAKSLRYLDSEQPRLSYYGKSGRLWTLNAAQTSKFVIEDELDVRFD